jgi:hypothetical protein
MKRLIVVITAVIIIANWSYVCADTKEQSIEENMKTVKMLIASGKKKEAASLIPGLIKRGKIDAEMVETLELMGGGKYLDFYINDFVTEIYRDETVDRSIKLFVSMVMNAYSHSNICMWEQIDETHKYFMTQKKGYMLNAVRLIEVKVKKRELKVGIEAYFLREMYKLKDKEVSNAAKKVLKKYRISLKVKKVNFKDKKEGLLYVMKTDMRTGAASIVYKEHYEKVSKDLNKLSTKELETKLKDDDWMIQHGAFIRLKMNPKTRNNDYQIDPLKKKQVKKLLVDIKHISEYAQDDLYGFSMIPIVLMIPASSNEIIPAVENEINKTNNSQYKSKLEEVIRDWNELKKSKIFNAVN